MMETFSNEVADAGQQLSVQEESVLSLALSISNLIRIASCSSIRARGLAEGAKIGYRFGYCRENVLGCLLQELEQQETAAPGAEAGKTRKTWSRSSKRGNYHDDEFNQIN
uniref:HTH araC/xylS-type domain-containing protein n=1 Tax=Macrostomum lignano TaxID=282301 RepID=A0A1I8FJS3_9PLAT